MANTIDVKGAIVNITPTKAVKFDKMMGSTGGAGGQGKSYLNSLIRENSRISVSLLSS